MFKKIINYLSQDYVQGGIIFGLMLAATIGCIGYGIYKVTPKVKAWWDEHKSTTNKQN